MKYVATLERDCEVEDTYTFGSYDDAERFKELIQAEEKDFWVEIHAVTEVTTPEKAFEDAERYHLGVA